MKFINIKSGNPGLVFLLGLIISFFSFQKANAQCGTDEYFKWRASQDPTLYAQHTAFNQIADQGMKQFKSSNATSNGNRVIPVVFHIMHNYGSENISKQNVLNQLATMNANYQKRNSDTSSVRSVFKSLIANCKIEFRLATIDPEGKCTDGIERIQTTLSYAGNDNVKGLSQWDPKKYLNIWVVQTIDLNTGLPPGYVVAGFSSFPTDNNLSLDGIVVRSDQVVSGNTTLTHECGHYFSLYHPFESYFGGPECGHNCSTTGDHVCDTPPTSSANYGCVTTTNSCTLDKPDLPDMIEAFMDYSNCPHMFTLGESARIESALVNTRRASLYTSTNLLATGTDSASQAATSCALPKADFYANVYTICRGGQVTFTDNTYNATVVSRTWTITNATPVSPSTTSSVNPTFTFPDTGTYAVTLLVSNANGSNQVQKKAYIHVISELSPVKTITEGFESGFPSAWTYSKDNKGLGWVVTSKASVTGSHSVYLNNLNGQKDSTYSFIIPEVDLGSLTNQTLTFKYAYAKTTASSADIFRILVSDNCASNPPKYSFAYNPGGGTNVTGKSIYTTDFVPTADEWTRLTVDLSGFKAIHKLGIKFTLQNRGGNNIYIDDINLDGKPSAIMSEPNPLTGISIYPNPASDQFTIKYPETLTGPLKIEAFDVTGKTVGTDFMNADNGHALQISRKSLNLNKDGVYYIKLSINGSSYIQKLVMIGNR